MKRGNRVNGKRKTGGKRTSGGKIRRLEATGEDELRTSAVRSYAPWRRPRKKRITLFLDADVLAWFKQEPRYQTRINRALWEVMKREKEESGE